MQKLQSTILPHLRRNWSVYVVVVLLLVPVVRLVFMIVMPCDESPLYFPSDYYDPVVYPELIAKHTVRECRFIPALFCGIPALSLLLLIFAKKNKVITISVVIACTVSFMLPILTFFSSWGDGTTLTEIGSYEFNGHIYHLAEAYIVRGGMDVHYRSLMLHECDLNDTNCYGHELNSYGYPKYENPSLVVNDEANQLEVWAGDELITIVTDDNQMMTPTPQVAP